MPVVLQPGLTIPPATSMSTLVLALPLVINLFRNTFVYCDDPTAPFYPLPPGHPTSTFVCLCGGMRSVKQQRVVNSNISAERTGAPCIRAI